VGDDANLADYLDSQRHNGSPCFCETAPPDIVKQVDAVILSGSRQWTAMVRWLGEQGITITKTKLSDHHTNGHVHARP
jgi:hypothetical protein